MADMPTLRQGTPGDYDKFRFAWKFDGALPDFVDHLHEPWDCVEKLQEFYLTVHVGPHPFDHDRSGDAPQEWWDLPERLPEAGWVDSLQSDMIRFM